MIVTISYAELTNLAETLNIMGVASTLVIEGFFMGTYIIMWFVWDD